MSDPVETEANLESLLDEELAHKVPERQGEQADAIDVDVDAL